MGRPEVEIVNSRIFEQSRADLGGAFLRILGYFREDGTKAVERIEQAMRAHDSAALVLPAHTLKGEARHFGALPLGDLAELIETGARKCVDHKETPDELLVHVAALSPLFDETLGWFERQTNPLVTRTRGFARAGVQNQSFGRI